MKTSLEDFKAYSTNPLGFKPPGQARSKPRQNAEKPRPATATVSGVSDAPAIPEPRSLPNISVLPIALRSDLIVQIAGLPFDLTKPEAQKIANIVLAHATTE